MAEDKIFAEGFSFKRSENAPEFVIGRLSIKIEEATAFMEANNKNGWVNLNVKKSKGGVHYLELDTFEPKKGGETAKPTPSGRPTPAAKQAPSATPPADDVDDLPF
jgi:hypothetical protein